MTLLESVSVALNSAPSVKSLNIPETKLHPLFSINRNFDPFTSPLATELNFNSVSEPKLTNSETTSLFAAVEETIEVLKILDPLTSTIFTLSDSFRLSSPVVVAVSKVRFRSVERALLTTITLVLVASPMNTPPAEIQPSSVPDIPRVPAVSDPPKSMVMSLLAGLRYTALAFAFTGPVKLIASASMVISPVDFNPKSASEQSKQSNTET